MTSDADIIGQAWISTWQKADEAEPRKPLVVQSAVGERQVVVCSAIGGCSVTFLLEGVAKYRAIYTEPADVGEDVAHWMKGQAPRSMFERSPSSAYSVATGGAAEEPES